MISRIEITCTNKNVGRYFTSDIPGKNTHDEDQLYRTRIVKYTDAGREEETYTQLLKHVLYAVGDFIDDAFKDGFAIDLTVHILNIETASLETSLLGMIATSKVRAVKIISKREE